MVIDKKEISTSLKFIIMLSFLVYAAILVASLVMRWSKTHLFEMCLTAIFVLWVIFILLKNFNYILYNSDGPKLTIRYTSLLPLSSGNFSVEIPKKDFVKAEIVNSIFGFRKNLVLYIRTPQGVAKYPKINISILKKEEIIKLRKDLNIE
ncbi:MAG: hypothetical protein GX793_00155 [Bacteroidales bacterium]|jgi:hypothetical protein|nr:hypothetical protein [Bacteroidales bacterium]MCK9498068.1 hypothetical protein [Bacteroidales bacterium]MDY0313520.1 hypothetical protein [Bacteroidales bacterium]NLB85452.1 hypothetical protein [Bacteroidales bacterium]